MWACSSANGRAFRGRPQQRRTPHSLARFSLGDTIADGWRVLSAEDSSSGQKGMYEACCTVLSRDVLQRRAA